jgi:hypothetical protein
MPTTDEGLASQNLESTVYQSQTAHAAQRRPLSHSPANSPHKHGKDGPKRTRTVAVRQLSTSSFQQVPISSQRTYISSQYSHLTLNVFQQSNLEKNEMSKLKSIYIQYLLLKIAATKGN